MIQFHQGSFLFSLADSKQIQVALGRCAIEGSTSEGQRFSLPLILDSPQIRIEEHGENALTYQGEDMAYGIRWNVEFIEENVPLCIKWRIEVANSSRSAIFIRKIIMLDQNELEGNTITFGSATKSEDLRFFSNGWQSWSTTGAYRSGSRMRRSHLGFLQNPMVVNPDTPTFRQRGMFSSDFFSLVIDKNKNSGFVLGFLSQCQQFGSISTDFRKTARLQMWANGDDVRVDPGQTITTDWAALFPFDLDSQDPFENYLNEVASEHGIRNLPASPAGWCSWYYYYQDISNGVIEENLEKIISSSDWLALDLVQIDDGFQAQVGDWLQTNGRFPEGLDPLSKRIKASGYKPGIWLAPFILHPAAKTAREHPEWLLRSSNGAIVRTGFVWNSLGAALDLTHPDALDYVKDVIDHTVSRWGFSYLKLDFLYAAALKGRYRDDTKTRAMVLRTGMEAIREASGPDTCLVGCGAPLGSMLGLVDVMRIGPDVNSTWEPSFAGISLPFRNEPSMPSARNSLHNILTRAPLHGRWWVNDPDCLLVRPDSKLTLPEVQSLATAIALTGGSLLVSDDMTKLPVDRQRIIAMLLPLIGRQARVIDLFDKERPSMLRLDLQGAPGLWHLLAYFNWEGKKQQIELNAGDFNLDIQNYLVRSFWDERVWRVTRQSSLFSGEIAPHGVLLLAVRGDERPVAYLGSDLHVSQGLEIKTWNFSGINLEFELDTGKKMAGCLDLKIYSNPTRVMVNSQSADINHLGNDFYRIATTVDKHQRFFIEL